MKNFIAFLAVAIAMTILSGSASAQNVVYTDASVFPLYGKVSEQTNERYERLPSSLEGVSREPVWYLGRHSAGLFVRFRSNSTSIHARWESTFNNTMTHMTDTGTKGLDLYALVDGEATVDAIHFTDLGAMRYVDHVLPVIKRALHVL